MTKCGEKWGDFMLMGEYHHNVDSKNRIIIPSKFRDELGDKFILTRGLDGCLFVYSNSEWNLIVQKLKELPFTKKDARSFVRFFLSGATEVEFDNQGRINIPMPLIKAASLIKECIIIGVNERLEIWAKDKWENFINDNEESLSDITENLFKTNIEI